MKSVLFTFIQQLWPGCEITISKVLYIQEVNSYNSIISSMFLNFYTYKGLCGIVPRWYITPELFSGTEAMALIISLFNWLTFQNMVATLKLAYPVFLTVFVRTEKSFCPVLGNCSKQFLSLCLWLRSVTFKMVGCHQGGWETPLKTDFKGPLTRSVLPGEIVQMLGVLGNTQSLLNMNRRRIHAMKLWQTLSPKMK